MDDLDHNAQAMKAIREMLGCGHAPLAMEVVEIVRHRVGIREAAERLYNESRKRELRLAAALMFYAHAASYNPSPRADRLGPPSPAVMQDRGGRAREALADTANPIPPASLPVHK